MEDGVMGLAENGAGGGAMRGVLALFKGAGTAGKASLVIAALLVATGLLWFPFAFSESYSLIVGQGIRLRGTPGVVSSNGDLRIDALAHAAHVFIFLFVLPADALLLCGATVAGRARRYLWRIFWLGLWAGVALKGQANIPRNESAATTQALTMGVIWLVVLLVPVGLTRPFRKAAWRRGAAPQGAGSRA